MGTFNPISSYPSGFGSGLSVRGLPILQTFGGNVFWVDSARGSNGNKGTRQRPFATLDYAIGRCTANQGDIILLRENHAETITGIGGITADIAGITIIGLGTYNQRPRFLMDGGTSVTFVVTAADVTISNLVFASGHLLITTCFNVTGVGCHIDRCEFSDNTTAENWATPVKATGAANTADGLKVTNCRWVPLIASVNELEFVEITDDIREMVIANNFIAHEGTASPLVLQAGTKVMHCAYIVNNHLSHKMTAGDLLIDNGGATNSGIIAYNFCGNADVTGAQGGGAATGMRFFENLYTSTAVDSGALEPAADTPLT
mgnify:CR=1 FL=1